MFSIFIFYVIMFVIVVQGGELVKDNDLIFYDMNECKTEFIIKKDNEFLFFDDNKNKKTSLSKKIYMHAVAISVFLIMLTVTSTQYKNTELQILSASINQLSKNIKLDEKLVGYQKNLNKIEFDLTNKYEILINSNNKIDEEVLSKFAIVDTIQENDLYANIKLEKETYQQYLKLKENLENRGYHIYITNGYKSLKASNMLYSHFENTKGKSYTKKYVVEPGASEHNLGLAFNFNIFKRKNGSNLDYNSDAYEYLENTAHLYGFIIRYPKGKEKITNHDYEPYHLRYVGASLAKYLRKNNLTLEEYYR